MINMTNRTRKTKTLYNFICQVYEYPIINS